MKSTPAAHRARPWRVHQVAADFDCIDVWRFDVGDVGLEKFLDVFWRQMRVAETWKLSRLRLAIGRAMGWDEKPNSLPIPGCTETTVAARLDATERRDGEPSPMPAEGVKPIYRFEKDALYEISNDTVHALLHVGMVPGGAELAVYVKSRGLFTDFYMAAIWPFRHFVIYPALISRVERAHTA